MHCPNLYKERAVDPGRGSGVLTPARPPSTHSLYPACLPGHAEHPTRPAWARSHLGGTHRAPVPWNSLSVSAPKLSHPSPWLCLTLQRLPNNG